MRTVYSVGVSLAGGGVGDRAYYAVKGLLEAGCLQRVYVSSSRTTDLPRLLLSSMGVAGRALRYVAFRVGTFRANHIVNQVFDAWVAAQLRPCDLDSCLE